MLNQLLYSLQEYARLRENDVNKGLYTREFATSLILSYSESMTKALDIIGQRNYIFAIQSEADNLCASISADYQPQARLHSSEVSSLRI